MNPVFVVILFLVLFALCLIAISLGFRFLEVQHKKQVAGILNVVDGKNAEQTETSILIDPEGGDPLEAFFKRDLFPKDVPRLIQQAGLDWSSTRLIGSMAAGAAIGVVIGVVFRPLGFLSLSILGPALLFGGLPYFYAAHKRRKRLAEFEQQLPEALDFLARSMRAGHAFSISLEMLGAESPDPLGQEFRTLFNEQNLGAPIEQALANFAEKVPLLDVKLFVSSVLLQKQTGGNLSEILMRLAYVIRERFRLRGQVKAVSSHGRMTAAVLSVLPIILILVLLFVAPDYLRGMADDPDGQWMIIGAVIAQVAGYFVMRNITNIKV